jgi:N-acyl-D-aspartate/D-glutamate deacylase
MHDIAIRRATIVNGSGAEPRIGDVAIRGGRIVAVDGIVGPVRRDIDARGRIFTPGWPPGTRMAMTIRSAPDR